MHACNAVTLSQLLSVRDGEPVAAEIATHAEECAVCAQELKRLRTMQAALRSLPQLPPPSYDAVALKKEMHRSRAAASRWTAAAVAAGVSAIALLLVITNASRIEDKEKIANSEPVSMPIENAATPSDRSGETQLASLVIRSQELESRLQSLPQRYIERGATATTINALQNRIQWVDYQLSLADDLRLSERQSAQLWRDRVQLMDTLVKVRYAETQQLAALQ